MLTASEQREQNEWMEDIRRAREERSVARHDEPSDIAKQYPEHEVPSQQPKVVANHMIIPPYDPFNPFNPGRHPYDPSLPYIPYRPVPTPEEQAETARKFREALEKLNEANKAKKAPEQPGKMRVFDSGATRNVDETKHDYEGFVSPLVLEGYGRYMHAHRVQADGSLRASDNWQKGIPIAAYRSSLIRHVFTAWSIWRGWPVPAEQVGTEKVVPTLKGTLYAILFNVMGYLHELEKEEVKQIAELNSQPIAKAFVGGHTRVAQTGLVSGMGGPELQRDVKG